MNLLIKYKSLEHVSNKCAQSALSFARNEKDHNSFDYRGNLSIVNLWSYLVYEISNIPFMYLIYWAFRYVFHTS